MFDLNHRNGFLTLLFRNIMDIFPAEFAADGVLILLNFMADKYL